MVIRTRMYSVAMQQSCTRRPRQLFPLNNEKVEEKAKEVEEEEEIHDYNPVFRRNETELYSL